MNCDRTTRFFISCTLTATLAAASCSCSFVEDGSDLFHLACSILKFRSGATSFSSGPIDVFIFNDDGNEGLDAIQHFDNSDGIVEVHSTSGHKKVIAVADNEKNNYDGLKILTFDGMRSLRHDLRNEDPASPVKCATFRFNSSEHTIVEAELRPLLCQVKLKELSVDFSGSPYAGKCLTDIRAYLTNVNCLCPYVDQEQEAESCDLINCGGLVSDDLLQFRHPDMILSDTVASGGIALYCYPGSSTTSSAVSPTRLVIEGKIDGCTYYYPIDIGNGYLRRGFTYIYEVKLTRKGSTDPDTVADRSAFSVKLSISDWIEFEDERRLF